MPYIKQKRRKALPPPVSVDTKGELNYMMTKLAIRYVQDRGLTYDSLSDVMATFVCASEEFYRRMGSVLEDNKIKENGDVFPSPESLIV